MSSCPKCGANIGQIGATGKGICPNCGIVELTPTSAQIELNKSEFCQYCGKQLTLKSGFCPSCGKPLTPEAKASTFPTSVATTHKPSNVWYLVPIFLTLLGSVIGYFALRDRDKRMARNLAIVGVIMPFVWIGMIAAIASLQVAPVQQPQIVVTTSPQKTTETLGEIKDLAYIKVNPAPYTDDADPEYEGIDIFIDCFDTKSALANFRNTPILVNIELYGYHDIYDVSKEERGELVYKTSRVIDHSYTLQWESSGYLRISFADIIVDQTRYVAFGTAKVMVQTAKGNFTASQGTLLFNPPE